MKCMLALLLIFVTPAFARPGPLLGLPESLSAVPLVDGDTRITLPSGILPPGLPPGATLHVFRANRENGNAWGFNLYLVTLSDESHKASIIGADALPGASDTSLRSFIEDAPHTGEDAIIALRFATGNVEGMPGLFLIEAVRDVKGPVPDPVPTVLQVFRLVSGDETPGWTPLYFQYFRTIPLQGAFCSADAALIRAGVEKPGATAAPRNPTGCFAPAH